jgi:hypothetical protein
MTEDTQNNEPRANIEEPIVEQELIEELGA